MNETVRRVVLFVVAVCVVCTAVGALAPLTGLDAGVGADSGIAFAQSDDEGGGEPPIIDDESEEGDGDEETDGESDGDTANESDADGGNEGEDNGEDEDSGGPVDVAQNAWGSATSTVGSAATGGAQAAAEYALGPVFEFIVGVPTIEIGLLEPGPIHPPTNWPMSELFWPIYMGIGLPLTTVVFTGVMVASLGTIPLSAFRPVPISTYAAWSKGLRAALALIVGVGFHLPLFTALHYAVNELNQTIAPNPAEMIEAMGLLQFGLASAVTGMGLYEMGWDVIKWVGIEYGIIWLYITLYPMFSMPLVMMAVYNPRSFYGRFSLYTLILDVAFLLSKFIAACLLFFMTTLDWTVSWDGLIAAFLSIASLYLALFTPPLVLIFMLLSKGRVLSAVTAGAGGALAGSSIASKARDSERLQNLRERGGEYAAEKTESGKSYAKRGAAKAQGKYWDVKNRSLGIAAVASRNPKLAAMAGKDRIDHWRNNRTTDQSMSSTDTSTSTDTGTGTETGSESGSSVTLAERMRNMERMNEQAGGLNESQRKRYFNMLMDKKGAFDSGLKSGTESSDDSTGHGGGTGGS